MGGRDDGRIHIIIDPGWPSDSHHETTKACLVLIERFTKELKGRRVLDVVQYRNPRYSALKLGYGEGRCRYDPLAIDAAKRNLLLNRIGNVEILEGAYRIGRHL